MLKNIKEYGAAQHDFSALAEGAKYSCAICRHGSHNLSALDKHRATTDHQRRVIMAMINTTAAFATFGAKRRIIWIIIRKARAT